MIFARNFSGVIATGGGTIENSKNLQNLIKNGELIFLNPDFSKIRKYLMKDKTRPRLNPDIPIHQEIDQMWMQRKPMYQASANFEVMPDYNGDVKEETTKFLETIPKNVIPPELLPKKIAILSSSNGTSMDGLFEAQEKGRIRNVEFTVFVTDKAIVQHFKKPKI